MLQLFQKRFMWWEMTHKDQFHSSCSALRWMCLSADSHEAPRAAQQRALHYILWAEISERSLRPLYFSYYKLPFTTHYIYCLLHCWCIHEFIMTRINVTIIPVKTELLIFSFHHQNCTFMCIKHLDYKLLYCSGFILDRVSGRCCNMAWVIDWTGWCPLLLITLTSVN